MNNIKKEIEDLKSELKQHNEAYYTYDAPKISDSEYDNLKQKLQDYRQKYPNLFSEKDEILDSVGAKTLNIFNKITHAKEMHSLSNAFSEQDISDFSQRIKRFLGLDKKQEQKNDLFSFSENEVKEDELSFFAEVKIDGLSFSARYENGKLKHVATRGDGQVGEDVTQNVKTIKNFPFELKTNNPPKIIEVRGEIYMPKDEFIKLNNLREENNQKLFANPRNVAAGSLRQLDKEITRSRNLSYFAYDHGELSDDFICDSQNDFISKIKEYGFITENNSRLCSSVIDIMNFYEEINDKRYRLNYDIDGMVYKVNSYNFQNRLGYISNSPRFAIAHKFEAQKGKTKIKDIIIQIGRTGALTPVAILEPVNIGGVLVTRATLHNQDEINRKDIRINDVVLVQRAGDVIPQIIKSFENERGKNTAKFEFPQQCPVCGSEIIENIDDVVLRCSGGLKCSAQLKELLKHFVSKDAFDISGLGKKQIDNFFEEGFIKSFADIFTLEKRDKTDNINLQNKEGWGEKSAQKLYFAINEKRKISLERFIYSIGIRYVGETTAKLIASHFISYQNFKNKLVEISKLNQNDLEHNQNFQDFVDIDGIGKKMAMAIVEYFRNQKHIEFLEDLEHEIEINDVQKVENNSALSGKSIVFTGTLQNMSRAEAKKRAEDLAMKVVGSVSNKTDFLVAGDKSGSKLKKAKELKVNILTEEEWQEMLQIN